MAQGFDGEGEGTWKSGVPVRNWSNIWKEPRAEGRGTWGWVSTPAISCVTLGKCPSQAELLHGRRSES